MNKLLLTIALAAALIVPGVAMAGCVEISETTPVCGTRGCESIITCADGEMLRHRVSLGGREIERCGDVNVMWREFAFAPHFWGEYGAACKKKGVTDSEFAMRLVDVAQNRPKQLNIIDVVEAQSAALNGYLTSEADVKPVTWGSHCVNKICEENMPTGSTFVHGKVGKAAWRFQVKNSPLSIDRELEAIAKQRGIKVGDNQMLAKVLVSSAMVNFDHSCSVNGVVTANDDVISENKNFIGSMAQTENLLIEGFHEAPESTVVLTKTLQARPVISYNHTELCKEYKRKQAAFSDHMNKESADMARESEEVAWGGSAKKH